MAINIVGNATRKPHGVSLAFAIAGMALVFGVVLAFYFSRGSAPVQTYKTADFSTEGVNPNWFNRNYSSAKPAAVSTVIRTSPQPPASHVIVPPQVNRPASNSAPNLAAQERTRRLMQAMSSDISVKIDGANVLETPQKDPQLVTANIRPAPPHTLPAWSFVYAVLTTPIDSDHSGDVLAKVSHAARDITQTEILIPVGSIVHGTQRGTDAANLNDQSLTVVWDDIQFPDGAHLPVPAMQGMDETGSPGLNGQVDRHVAQIWLPAVLTSAITAGIMLAQNPTYGGFQGYNGEQQASGAFASSMGGFATRGLNSQLMSVRPTIRINAGTPIRILVNRNFVFPGPYQG